MYDLEVLQLLLALRNGQTHESWRLAYCFIYNAELVDYVHLAQHKWIVYQQLMENTKDGAVPDVMRSILHVMNQYNSGTAELHENLTWDELISVVYTFIFFWPYGLDSEKACRLMYQRKSNCSRNIAKKVLVYLYANTRNAALLPAVVDIAADYKLIYRIEALRLLIQHVLSNQSTADSHEIAGACVVALNQNSVVCQMLGNDVYELCYRFPDIPETDYLLARIENMAESSSMLSNASYDVETATRPVIRPTSPKSAPLTALSATLLSKSEQTQREDEHVKLVIDQVCHYKIKPDEAYLSLISNLLHELDLSLPKFYFLNYYATKSRLPTQLVHFVNYFSKFEGDNKVFLQPGVIAAFNIMYMFRDNPNATRNMGYNGQSIEYAAQFAAQCITYSYKMIMADEDSIYRYILIQMLRYCISLLYHWIIYSSGRILQQLSNIGLAFTLIKMISDDKFMYYNKRSGVELAAIINRIVLFQFQYTFKPIPDGHTSCYSAECARLLYTAICGVTNGGVDGYDSQTVASLLMHTLSIVLMNERNALCSIITLLWYKELPNVLDILIYHFFADGSSVVVWNPDILYATVSLAGAFMYCASELQWIGNAQSAEICATYLSAPVVKCVIYHLLQAPFPQIHYISHFLLFLTSALRHYLNHVVNAYSQMRAGVYDLLDNILSLLFTYFNYHLTAYNIVFCLPHIIQQFQKDNRLAYILAILLGIGFRGCISRQYIDYGDDRPLINATVDYYNYRSLVSEICRANYCFDGRGDLLLTEMLFLHFLDAERLNQTTIGGIASNYCLDYAYFTQHGYILQILHAQNIDRISNLRQTVTANISPKYASISSLLLLIKLFYIAFSSAAIQKDKMIADLSDLLANDEYLQMLAQFRFSDIQRMCCVYREQVSEFVRQINWDRVPRGRSFVDRVRAALRSSQ